MPKLLVIADAMAAQGAGVVQLISDLYQTPDDEVAQRELDLLEQFVRTSGRPLSFTMQQAYHSPERWRYQMDWVDRMVAAGLDVKAQVASRPIGVLLGLQATANPFLFCASYDEVSKLPLSERVVALSDPERKAALCLSRGLAAARARFTAGERDPVVLIGMARAKCEAEALARIDYIELRDAASLEPVEDEVRRPAVLAMAVFIGNVPGDGTEGFALAYAANTLILVVLWFRTGVHDPSHRPGSVPYSTGYLVSTVLFADDYSAANPHLRYFVGEHGYGLVTVTPEELRCEFHYIEDEWDPDSPLSHVDTWVVRDGEHEAQPV